jgi:hypothetical protein
MPLIDRQINGQKYVQNPVRGEGTRDRILVKQALAKTAFGSRIFQNTQKRPKIAENPMKQAISGAVTNRKRTIKMTVKNESKIDPKAESKIDPKADPKSTQK